MGIEFELKYRLDASLLQQLRQQIPGPEQILHMQTVYYDTAAGSFSQRKCTLRRRMENGKSICTLKTPAAGFGRQEWETECDCIEQAIGRLRALGAPADVLSLAEPGLLPICGAAFTRIAKTVVYEDAVLELALDEGILTGGGRECPLCEMEVELKSGSQHACMAFARQLAQRYGLPPEPHSKFRRALNLYKGETHGSAT